MYKAGGVDAKGKRLGRKADKGVIFDDTNLSDFFHIRVMTLQSAIIHDKLLGHTGMPTLGKDFIKNFLFTAARVGAASVTALTPLAVCGSAAAQCPSLQRRAAAYGGRRGAGGQMVRTPAAGRRTC